MSNTWFQLTLHLKALAHQLGEGAHLQRAERSKLIVLIPDHGWLKGDVWPPRNERVTLGRVVSDERKRGTKLENAGWPLILITGTHTRSTAYLATNGLMLTRLQLFLCTASSPLSPGCS